jgi:hypothetical protein
MMYLLRPRWQIANRRCVRQIRQATDKEALKAVLTEKLWLFQGTYPTI